MTITEAAKKLVEAGGNLVCVKAIAWAGGPHTPPNGFEAYVESPRFCENGRSLTGLVERFIAMHPRIKPQPESVDAAVDIADITPEDLGGPQ